MNTIDLPSWRCGACGRVDVGAARPSHCGLCGRFNSYGRRVPFKQDSAPAAPAPSPSEAFAGPAWVKASTVPRKALVRLRGACPAWDRVTGGLALGHVYVLGAVRGIGKSRYLLHTLSTLAQLHELPLRVLHAEQSAEEVARTLDEIRAPSCDVRINDGGDVSTLEPSRALWLVDALRAASWQGEPCKGASSAEAIAIRHCLTVARAGGAVVLVQHVDEQSGDLMGGQLVASLCHVILGIERVEGEQGRYRLVCRRKNRAGPDDQVSQLQRHLAEGGRLVACEDP